MNATAARAREGAAERISLAAMMAQAGLANGWNKAAPAMWPLPKKEFRPAHWSYEAARAILDVAGALVSTEFAERRNVILANPIPGNDYPTVRTLVSAYQMVKPGETARSHRHTANALRLVLDAEPGMFTIVEGKRIPMAPGDVLLTPNWHWHGHSNEGSANAYWLDFLDVPLVQVLGPMFFEHHPEGIERDAPVEAHAPLRFSRASIEERLAAAAEAGLGLREIVLSPRRGPAFPSIGLKAMRLARRASFRHGPVTANALFAVIEGDGAADVDERGFVWCRGDVVAVPAGCRMICRAGDDSLLLKVSDEPLFRALDWLRPIP